MPDKKPDKDQPQSTSEAMQAEEAQAAPFEAPVDMGSAKDRAVNEAGMTPEEFDQATEAHAIDADAQRTRLDANFQAGDEQADTVREANLKQANAERVSRGFEPMDTKSERTNKLLDAYYNGRVNYEQLAETYDLDVETVRDLIEADQADKTRQAEESGKLRG